MKRISLMTMMALLYMAGNAQYKKASFFQRGHKTYGFTAGMKMFSDGVKPAANVNFMYGNDKGRNRIFHWWDLDYTMGSNYSYTTTASPSGTATINGKAGGFLSIGYNWGVYLLDNKKEENKVLPFLKIGFTGIIAGRRLLNETVTPANVSPNRGTQLSGNLGADAGAGVLYKISEKLGFFGNAGYRAVFTGDNYGNYPAMSNHPYVNAGIRVLIAADE